MVKVVLTADRAVFTDYHGVDLFGFGLCMPYRLIPSVVENLILVPKAKTGRDGRAKFAPYSLCKVEAALLASGFGRSEVVVTPPHRLEEVVDSETAVVAVHVLDPKGLAPVTWTLRSLTGGGKSCTEAEFENLMRTVKELRREHDFKLIVGGPGVWQLRGMEKRYDIDVLYEGEAELTFPGVVKAILNGGDVPSYVEGEPVPVQRIPLIMTPSRNGQVQITRGCPRRCRFCSPTMWRFRSMPVEIILKELEFNLKNGAKGAGLITEDVLLYGARGLQLNPEAVEELYEKVTRLAKRYGVGPVDFTHVSCSSALYLKDTVRRISETMGLDEKRAIFPQVGLESGSPAIVGRYFRGKVYPWRPEEWPEVVASASKVFNDNHWYPCYTYLIGYPDATPDDYVKTTELLDRLEEEGFMGWTFPLFLIPMGGTMIEKEARFLDVRGLPEEALECMLRGWELSVRFSKRVTPTLIGGGAGALSGIMKRLAGLAVKAMEVWIEGIRKNPEVIEREYSKVWLRGVKNFIGAILHGISTLREGNGPYGTKG